MIGYANSIAITAENENGLKQILNTIDNLMDGCQK